MPKEKSLSPTLQDQGPSQSHALSKYQVGKVSTRPNTLASSVLLPFPWQHVQCPLVLSAALFLSAYRITTARPIKPTLSQQAGLIIFLHSEYPCFCFLPVPRATSCFHAPKMIANGIMRAVWFFPILLSTILKHIAIILLI